MLTRRKTLILGAATGAAALLPTTVAAARTWQDIIADFTGGTEPDEGGITITAPEIAENGNAVPITVAAPGATEIVMVATDNPSPGIGRFRFLEGAGAAMVATRVRLGGTQDILAVARFADGRLTQTRVEVNVTVGGCAD
jgi:sulfur-oxidizing protein SoxY